ncbi:peptidoglycan/LPS O-acetylase OafA/YrhL [Tunturiibacter psychrotolerans]
MSDIKIKTVPTFRGIQVLRGLAACMVVIHHSTQSWSQSLGKGVSAPTWEAGAAGVDIFFVISGFVMAISTIGREDKTHPAVSFLERRLIRIYPLYWIVSLVYLLKVTIVRWYPRFAGTGQHVQTPLGYIVSSFLLIPYRDSLGHIQPLLNVGWTLSFEMFFYLLFALALALRVRVAYFLTPIMSILVVAGTFHGAHWPAILLVLTDPMLLEFLAGVLLGQLVIQGVRLNVATSALLLIVAPMLFFFAPRTPIRVLQWGVPAALLVSAFVMLEDRFEGLWPRWALLLGDASYSLYLSHFLVLIVLAKRMVKISTLTSTHLKGEIASVLIMSCCATLVSIVLYRVVEQPINRKLRRSLLTESETRRVILKVA